MPCNELSRQLDDFMDGALTARASEALTRHVESCADCQAVHAAERSLRSSLARLPVDAPSPDYYERALAFARRQRRRNDPRRSSRFGSFALAAVATMVIAIGVATLSDRIAPSASIPEVTIALEAESSVNLVFSTATALADATVSLELPDGIEVVGHPGKRELAWTTDLRPGKNALRLPLVARIAVNDELIARVRHDGEESEFRMRVRVI